MKERISPWLADVPTWLVVAFPALPLAAIVLTVVQRHGGRSILPGALAVFGFGLQFVWGDRRVYGFAGYVAVCASVLVLVWNPLAFDFAPFLIVLGVAYMGLVAPQVDSVAALVAGAAVMCYVELAGRFQGAIIWVLGFGLAWVAGFAVRNQLGLLAELRAAQASLAERAAAEERSRIAREIHDVIAHSMAVTLLHVTAARMNVESDPAAAVASLEDAERLGRQSLADIRRTVGLLEGASASTRALPGAADIDDLIGSFAAAGLEVTLDKDGDLGAVPSAAGLGLYRIVQESLANVAKHAPSSPAIVRLRVGATEVRLVVSNDCDTEPVAGNGGLGLQGMADRAALLGGTLRAGPIGGVWSVEGTIPLGQ